MRKAIGYIIFSAGVALWLTGCATEVPSKGITAQPASSHWQEYNTAVQDQCDADLAKFAMENGVTAKNINDPGIQHKLTQLRWLCAQQQGLTL